MRVGLTWGVWDMLHVGHTRLLERAAGMVDALLVGVTTDEACLARKGKLPVVPYEQRREMLRAVRWVDGVFPQDETRTKAWAVARHNPFCLFVADDWTPATYDGEGLGVPVIYLPRTKGVSSSMLREVARER